MPHFRPNYIDGHISQAFDILSLQSLIFFPDRKREESYRPGKISKLVVIHVCTCAL